MVRLFRNRQQGGSSRMKGLNKALLPCPSGLVEARYTTEFTTENV